jgi:predicted DNA-binding protein
MLYNYRENKMSLIAIRLTDQLNKRIEEVSKKTERSKSFIIRKGIESYLEELEDAHDALNILNDPTTKWLDYDGSKKKLDLD